jgi:tRNA-guanine family transglycosylase
MLIWPSILFICYDYTLNVLCVSIIRSTTRWLDRCLKAHQNADTQNIFPIVQGGLNTALRTESAKQLIQREVPGFAIGGLR